MWLLVCLLLLVRFTKNSHSWSLEALVYDSFHIFHVAKQWLLVVCTLCPSYIIMNWKKKCYCKKKWSAWNLHFALGFSSSCIKCILHPKSKANWALQFLWVFWPYLLLNFLVYKKTLERVIFYVGWLVWDMIMDTIHVLHGGVKRAWCICLESLRDPSRHTKCSYTL